MIDNKPQIKEAQKDQLRFTNNKKNTNKNGVIYHIQTS